MSKISFLKIPQTYECMLSSIRNESILNLYSKFNYLYFLCNDQSETSNDYDENRSNIEDFLFSHLKNPKFLIYHYQLPNKKNFFKLHSNLELCSELINVIICTEGECLIIERINRQMIRKIFQKLKEGQISILNVTTIIENDNETTEENEAKEEINIFCSNFLYEIKKNEFVRYTLPSIAGYIIRRFFYPSYFYRDQTFFMNQYINPADKKQITKIINTKYDNLTSFIDDLSKSVNFQYDEKRYQEFKEKDFIFLRILHNNQNAQYRLGIHCKSFHIFMIKIIYPDAKINHEIDFCKNYHHHCFVPFYGFIKEKEQIIGVVYEYMSNGTLSSYITSNKCQYSELYSLLTICRIFRGIEYLQSQKLIHRDLKPSNILIDHNFLPYISDFETIRHPCCENENSSFFTNDIGSLLYTSPEQYQGECTSYPTDIFSFGQIIYFLYEKKNPNNNSSTNNIQFLPLSSASNNIRNLYYSCVKDDPNKRPSVSSINKILNDEFDSFYYFENILLKNETVIVDNSTIIDFIVERCIFLPKKSFFHISNVFYFSDLLHLVNEKNYSSLFLNLGHFYYFGFYKQDYYKARYYYKKAGEQNNSFALLQLGNIFYFGKGIKQNYRRAKEYYEQSAYKNNSIALFNLGNYYYNIKYYELAIKYYQLSADLNNPFAFLQLGNIYFLGQIINTDWAKAKKLYESYYKIRFHLPQNFEGKLEGKNKNFYLRILNNLSDNDNILYRDEFYYLNFEISMDQFINIDISPENIISNYNQVKRYDALLKLNKKDIFNPISLLGDLYHNCERILPCIKIAIKFFKISSKLDNSEASLRLGDIYSNGVDIKPNYKKAKKYYELSAKLNNPEALLKLGDIYYNGQGVVKNIQKAKKFYELSAKQNNPDAFTSLGNIYCFGLGVEKNYLRAKILYEESILINEIKSFKTSPLSPKSIEILSSLEKTSDVREFSEYGSLNEDFKKAKKIHELFDNQNNSDYFYQKSINISLAEINKLNSLLRNTKEIDKLPIICERMKQSISKVIKNNELYTKVKKAKAFLKLGYFFLNGKFSNEYPGVKSIQSLKYSIIAATICCYEYQIGLASILFECSVPRDMTSKYCNDLYKKPKNNHNKINDYNEIYKEQKSLLNDLVFGENIQIYNKEFKEQCPNKDAYSFLGHLFYFGNGVEQNYSTAYKYYKLSLEKNDNYEAYNFIANLYYFGDGVERNTLKAKRTYERLLESNNSNTFYYLGNLYYDGYDIPKDYLRARKYYESSADQNNSNGFLGLGNIYYNGFDVEKDYQKAKYYYERSAKSNNTLGLFNIGYLYYQGHGVEKDYLRAKKYFELSSQQNNPEAFLYLGDMYFNGEGVKRDYYMAYQYYKLASNLNHPEACFKLGCMFSTGDVFKIENDKAIQYFLKCQKIHFYKFAFYNLNEDSFTFLTKYNNYYNCVSKNDIGLIYITQYEDIEKAEAYIKEATFGEYQFAQNNYGLLHQFYLNNVEYAQHNYEKSSSNNFALAEYNIGYLKEKEGKKEESIYYYIKASEHEKEKLIFKNCCHYDKRLEISKTFIICFTNLKLFQYYFELSNFEESKKYFVRSFSNLILNGPNMTHKFHFIFNTNETESNFSYLRFFIFNYPLFNFTRQIKNNFGIKKQISGHNPNNKYNQNIILKTIFNDPKSRNLKIPKNKLNFEELVINETIQIENDIFISDDIIFNSPDELFDYIFKFPKFKELFIKEINEIIQNMKEILLVPPYSILFGRINIENDHNKREENNKFSGKDINELFYEGLSLEDNLIN